MMSPNMVMSPSGLVSPARSRASRFSDGNHSNRDALPFNRSPSSSDFEIERTPRTPAYPKKSLMRRSQTDYDSDQVLRTSVSSLIAARTRSFAVSGRIPLDPSALVLFFRSKVSVELCLLMTVTSSHVDLERDHAQSRFPDRC
jgi:hypothetical protein